MRQIQQRTADHAGMVKENGRDIVSRELIRKYVAYAKRTIHPVLTDEAKKLLSDFYIETRRQGGENPDSVSITN